MDALLSDLALTSRQLQQIKAEQSKDHERVSKSFEKTLLSILRQEQIVLNLVEEEHHRLSEELSSIQRTNELALQQGVSEIDSIVREIEEVSSQLRLALGPSNTSERDVMREIQERVSNIFRRREGVTVRLRKVYFTPQSLVSRTLGEIGFKEQVLGFSVLCPKRRGLAGCDRNGSPVLIHDQNPPGEKVFQDSDSPSCLNVKTLQEQAESKVVSNNEQNMAVSSWDQVLSNDGIIGLAPQGATRNGNEIIPSLTMNYTRRQDKTSTGGMSPRSVSPTESETSTYTFIIETAGDTGGRLPSHPMRNMDSAGRPVISSSDEKSKTNIQLQSRKSSDPAQIRSGLTLSGFHLRNQLVRPTSASRAIPRSTSRPYIERIPRKISLPSRPISPATSTGQRHSMSRSPTCWPNPRNVVSSNTSGSTQELRVQERSSQYWRKSELNVIDFPLEGGAPYRLIKQFGKLGSGRSELKLPHGIHATATGLLYVVDYGNRRLQVMDVRGKILQHIVLKAKSYFDVAVNSQGLIALTNSTNRTVEVYNKHGRFLHAISKNWGAPRGITANHQDDFIMADMRLGSIWTLTLDSSTGCHKECTVVPGFNKPYLIDSNRQGLLAISERGIDGGCCVKIIGEDWKLLTVVGIKDSPSLLNPRGVCIDNEGGVLVADWGQEHSIIYYSPTKAARFIVKEGLRCPRGLALWQDRLLLVADSMNNCIKVFQYQEIGD
ncbi:uncharacterized protein RCH25_049605 [Pelodytes ibericus]